MTTKQFVAQMMEYCEYLTEDMDEDSYLECLEELELAIYRKRETFL